MILSFNTYYFIVCIIIKNLYFHKGAEPKKNTPSKYVGGEMRTVKEGNELSLALVFESV